ncbi:MAG: tyrosine-type recombinase/integrase [Oscillospiraceae bacterium]|nr:tyrosine-type recombinase/integrase [Oscillospiraceae bacterium]
MRNPNGYGSVVKLSGNRRRPYHVRKTVGFNEKGHPVYQTLDYTTTREEGMILLATFNKNPWDVDKANMTLSALFELWLERKAVKFGRSNQSSMKSVYQHCKSLWSYKYTDIKAYHMQDTIDYCGCGYSTQGAIKALWGHLDKFALELDITTRNYSSLLQSAPIPETSKSPFSEDEIKAIWQMQSMTWADSVLFLLYTGFRVSEMLDLRKDAVNLVEGTITGGTKTKAGKDRVVPIHSLIRHIIENRMSEDGEYLFSNKGKHSAVATYRMVWNEVMRKAAMQHTPHDCRHTFRSRLDSAGANKRCIDLMMGHKSKDVGERVYTHKTLDELRAAIELVTH